MHHFFETRCSFLSQLFQNPIVPYLCFPNISYAYFHVFQYHKSDAHVQNQSRDHFSDINLYRIL